MRDTVHEGDQRSRLMRTHNLLTEENFTVVFSETALPTAEKEEEEEGRKGEERHYRGKRNKRQNSGNFVLDITCIAVNSFLL